MMNELRLLCGIFLLCLRLFAVAQVTQTSPTPKSTLTLAPICLMRSSPFGFVQAGSTIHVKRPVVEPLHVFDLQPPAAKADKCKCPNPNSLGCVNSLNSNSSTSWMIMAPPNFMTVGGWVSLRPGVSVVRPSEDNKFIFSPIIATFDTALLNAKLINATIGLGTPEWGFGICSQDFTNFGFGHSLCWLSQNASHPVGRVLIGEKFTLVSREPERTIFFSIKRVVMLRGNDAILSVFSPHLNWKLVNTTVDLPFPATAIFQAIYFGSANRSSSSLGATFDTFYASADNVENPTAANGSLSLCFETAFGTPPICTPSPTRPPAPTTLPTRSTSASLTNTSTRTNASLTTQGATTKSTSTTKGQLQINTISDPQSPKTETDTIAIILFVVAAILIIVGAGFVIVLLR